MMKENELVLKVSKQLTGKEELDRCREIIFNLKDDDDFSLIRGDSVKQLVEGINDNLNKDIDKTSEYVITTELLRIHKELYCINKYLKKLVEGSDK